MKLIILDYSSPRVAIIKDVPAEICNSSDRVEKYLHDNGFKPTNCSWMSVEDGDCNDISVFKYHTISEHLGEFDINTDGMGDTEPEYDTDISEDEDSYDIRMNIKWLLRGQS